MATSGRRPMITFSVRPNVLWRESGWRCECSHASSRWVGTLYLEDEIIAQHADGLPAVLAMTERWRHAVRTIPNDPNLTERLRARQDRRENVAERRAVPRGGRRSTDPGLEPE
jgi:hypothetical protein